MSDFECGFSEGYNAGRAEADTETEELRCEISCLEEQLCDLRGELEDHKRWSSEFEEQADKVPGLEDDIDSLESDVYLKERELEDRDIEITELAPMADKYIEITDYLQDQYPDVLADLVMRDMIVK